jgi:hypothetical protein
VETEVGVHVHLSSPESRLKNDKEYMDVKTLESAGNFVLEITYKACVHEGLASTSVAKSASYQQVQNFSCCFLPKGHLD